MFLLNSRASLATAPCNRIHTNTIAGIPHTKDTGLICRIPLERLLPLTLGSSPRGTCAGSGYDCLKFFITLFSRSQGLNQMNHTAHYS